MYSLSKEFPMHKYVLQMVCRKLYPRLYLILPDRLQERIVPCEPNLLLATHQQKVLQAYENNALQCGDLETLYWYVHQQGRKRFSGLTLQSAKESLKWWKTSRNKASDCVSTAGALLSQTPVSITLIRPVAIYGTESWNTTTEDEEQLAKNTMMSYIISTEMLV